MLSTANSDEKDYGISAISAGLGTVGGYGLSKYFNPKFQYIGSEFFGDKDRLKEVMEMMYKDKK